MHHKTALCLSDSDAVYDRMRRLSTALDASILMTSLQRFDEALQERPFDLVILDTESTPEDALLKYEASLAERGSVALLLIAPVEGLAELQIPARITSDVIVDGASDEEFEFRIRQLLWPGEEVRPHEVIHVEDLVINLATFQVTKGEEVIDLTYLEYGLLSFLAAHPGRTYSREALLQRVWGFDYLGGTRTVDVHIRRIRAKIGDAAASHIETVRGVGYLFSS